MVSPTNWFEVLYEYVVVPRGTVGRFTGIEWIERDGRRLYELTYCGGRVLP